MHRGPSRERPTGDFDLPFESAGSTVYKLKIILRYLRARRITVIPILAATVAVFSLIVVLSVMRGFSTFIQKRIRGTLSDVIVEYDDVRGFSDWEALARKLKTIPGVKAVSPHLSGKAMLTLYSRGRTQQAWDFHFVFIGIDFEAENRTSELHALLVGARNGFEWRRDGDNLPGLIVGNEMFAHRFDGQELGYPASLTTPTATDEDSSLAFRITDHFKTELYEYDRTTVYIPLAAAQQLTRLPGRITSFSVRADDDVDLNALKAPIARVLPPDDGFVVMTWMESQKVLIDAMKLERVIWVVILSALLAVAGFCVLAVMSLTVLQKTRDIGIIRSIGARIAGVLWTFILYGLVVGFIGSTLGLVGGVTALHYLDPIESFCLSGRLAVLAAWLVGLIILLALSRLLPRGAVRLCVGAAVCVGWTITVWGMTAWGFLGPLEAFGRDYMSWTPWPRDVFYFEKIPRDMNWTAMLTFWAGGILVAFLASILPAVRAARTNPVHTLRYEH